MVAYWFKVKLSFWLHFGFIFKTWLHFGGWYKVKFIIIKLSLILVSFFKTWLHFGETYNHKMWLHFGAATVGRRLEADLS